MIIKLLTILFVIFTSLFSFSGKASANTIDACTAFLSQQYSDNGTTKTGTGCVEAGPVDLNITITKVTGNPYPATLTLNFTRNRNVFYNITGSPAVIPGEFIADSSMFNQEIGAHVKIYGNILCTAPRVMVKETCSPAEREVVPNAASGFKLCEQIMDQALKAECEECADDPNNPQGIWTAVGCIDKAPQNIISKLIEIGLGMGGGIALLMILGASFMLTTSQGDPKRTGEAKEMITAALIGLVFVIFSVTILQFIGFTILRIPGFGGP